MHCGKIIFVDLLFDDDLFDLLFDDLPVFFLFFNLEKVSNLYIPWCIRTKSSYKRAVISPERTVLSAHCTQSGLVLSGDFLTTNGCSMMKFEKGWRSGESTCLPLIWAGQFKFQCGRVCAEFVVGSLLCSKRFFSRSFSFPLSSKTNIFNFELDQVSGRWRTTKWMCCL